MRHDNLLKPILQATRYIWDQPGTRASVRKEFAAVIEVEEVQTDEPDEVESDEVTDVDRQGTDAQGTDERRCEDQDGEDAENRFGIPGHIVDRNSGNDVVAVAGS